MYKDNINQDRLYVHVRYGEYPRDRCLCGAVFVDTSPAHAGACNSADVAHAHLNPKEEWCPECLAHPNYPMLLLAATEI